MKYAWVESQRDEYPIRTLCRVLEVSHSGYYEWRKRPPSNQALRREKILRAATASHSASNRIYGYRKVHQDLLQQEIVCCLETVRRVMRSARLFSKVKRGFVSTTDSDHAMAVANNVLARDFDAAKPNEKWTADITYIPTSEGWLYLAVVMDLFSRRIVGWATSSSLESSLAVKALQMAIQHRRPNPGLIHHSDRGSQYASDVYRNLLHTQVFVGSMSRKGNCWDNAPTESFFGKFKSEWMDGNKYSSRSQARSETFKYIELFYNSKRRHAALGYLTPNQFEERSGNKAQTAA